MNFISASFVTEFSSDNIFHKEKDDRNLRFYETRHTEMTGTTAIEGKFKILYS